MHSVFPFIGGYEVGDGWDGPKSVPQGLYIHLHVFSTLALGVGEIGGHLDGVVSCLWGHYMV